MRYFILIIVMFGLSGSLHAQSALPNYYSGVEAENQQKYKKAYQFYQTSAKAGNTQAMVRLANLLILGQYESADKQEGLKWLLVAAQHHDADAYYLLGSSYDFGYGVDTSREQAMSYYKKAADLGHFRAMHNLGFIYQHQLQRPDKALELYKMSADSGYDVGMYELGFLYEHGSGTSQDLPKARFWYQKAADKNYGGALNNLGYMYETGEGVPVDYKKAFELYKKGIDGRKNTPECFNNLARMYANGWGTTKDYHLAQVYYQGACLDGLEQACYAFQELKRKIAQEQSTNHE